MSALYKRGVMTLSKSAEESERDLNIRLNRKYSPSKIAFLWSLERTWEKCIYKSIDSRIKPDFTPVYLKLEFTIRNKAGALGRRYSNKRISPHDFESELWKTTWDIVERYYLDEWGQAFLLLETLELAWKRRVINVVRKALETKRGSFYHNADPLPDHFEQTFADPRSNTEKRVIDRLFVEELGNTPALTQEEKRLYFALYDNPSGSFRELGNEAGINPHPQNVRRTLNRIRKKLELLISNQKDI